MDNRTKWILARVRMGWMFLAAGAFVAIVGILTEFKLASLPYNFRIITGLGITLIGIGIGELVRFKIALKDEQSARRLTVEERDERTVQIRARAGNKAYWVSTALVYIGLMWASFAANGGLPALTGDALWFFLAAGFLIPFGVYIASILIDERNL
jgi:ABC-type uncharacterized transport system permease subunit